MKTRRNGEYYLCDSNFWWRKVDPLQIANELIIKPFQSNGEREKQRKIIREKEIKKEIRQVASFSIKK